MGGSELSDPWPSVRWGILCGGEAKETDKLVVGPNHRSVSRVVALQGHVRAS